MKPLSKQNTVVSWVDLIFLNVFETIEVKIGTLGSRSRTEFSFKRVSHSLYSNFSKYVCCLYAFKKATTINIQLEKSFASTSLAYNAMPSAYVCMYESLKLLPAIINACRVTKYIANFKDVSIQQNI